jgi:vacuolar-type H+-ATPase subunit D/Vma8
LTSETVTTTQKELKQLEVTLQNLQKEKEFSESKRRSLKEEYQKLLEKIEIQKNELEKSVFKLIGKKILVVLATGQ